MHLRALTGDLVDLDGDGAPGVCDELCLSNGMLKDNDDDGDGWSDKLETEYGADPTSPNSVLSFLQRGSDIDGENAGDLSGIVSINGDGSVVAIGATGNDFMAQDAGQVRVFELKGEDWVQRGDSLYGDVAGAQFGQSLSLNLSGDTIAIGAPRRVLWRGTRHGECFHLGRCKLVTKRQSNCRRFCGGSKRLAFGSR